LWFNPKPGLRGGEENGTLSQKIPNPKRGTDRVAQVVGHPVLPKKKKCNRGLRLHYIARPCWKGGRGWEGRRKERNFT
jgi:hypothetical protein